MKTILTAVALLLTTAVFSQSYSWKADTVITAWATIDTLSKKPITTSKRDWVLSRWKIDVTGITTLIYVPNQIAKDVTVQNRVCRITGIIQQRRRTITVTMNIPQTEYQRVIDSLIQTYH